MNLLIIEDELRLSDMLRDYFVGKDHAVTLCGDGWNGLDTALTGRYDVIVLDVMLPGMDGFEVLRRLRAADDDTPVLMLTARSSLQDKLAGFESGAEDYLTKPFDIEELEARLCVLTKKRAGAENAALRFGALGADWACFAGCLGGARHVGLREAGHAPANRDGEAGGVRRGGGA